MIKGVHHAGIAVADLKASIDIYAQADFKLVAEFGKPEDGLKAAIVEKSGTRIELFQFDNLKTETAKKVRNHLALESTDLDADIKPFLAKGWNISIPISKGAFAKRFIYLEDELNNQIELIELHESRTEN